MKKFLVALALVGLMVSNLYAQHLLHDLTEVTNPSATDMTYVEVGPGTTNLDRKLTIGNLIGVYFDFSSLAAGDMLYYNGSKFLRLPKGTAYQLMMMNSGATAPSWGSSVGATANRLTKGWFTDLESTNMITVNGVSLGSIFQAAGTYAGLGAQTFTGKQTFLQSAAGSSGYAPINMPHGAAPTTNLANGDCWTTTSGLYCRINGSTVGPYGAAGSATDADAIHTNVNGEIAGITAKGTPTASDLLLIEDAAASNAKKKVTIGTLPIFTGLTSGSGTPSANCTVGVNTYWDTNASVFYLCTDTPNIWTAEIGIGTDGSRGLGLNNNTSTVATPTGSDGIIGLVANLPVFRIGSSSVTSILYSGGAAGTPSGITLTNGTGLPIAGIAGLGTGVPAALAVNASAVGGFPVKIASGSLALATSSIGSQACQTVTQGSVNSAAATGVATTDVIMPTPNASIKGVTGYAPLTTGGLTIALYPTSGYVNADVCNWTGSAITPGAVTINWLVLR